MLKVTGMVVTSCRQRTLGIHSSALLQTVHPPSVHVLMLNSASFEKVPS